MGAKLGIVILLRHSVTAILVAAYAAAALLLQALLLSMTAPPARAAASIDLLALHALCLAAPQEENSDGSLPLPRHANHDCCILCTVPGLATGGTVVALATPIWDAPLAAPLGAGRSRVLLTPFERAPIKARAPPA